MSESSAGDVEVSEVSDKVSAEKCQQPELDVKQKLIDELKQKIVPSQEASQTSNTVSEGENNSKYIDLKK